jgi:hypothetical protein
MNFHCSTGQVGSTVIAAQAASVGTQAAELHSMMHAASLP